MSAEASHAPLAAPETPPKATHCEAMAAMVANLDLSDLNLCAEHCHQGEQSEQAATLAAPPALLTSIYITPLASVDQGLPCPAAGVIRAPVAASPPHTLLHCCFRI
jgi:hypothetical protein